MEFGVYLQCYKKPYATYQAINSVRTHYPDCTIVILSDNGYDYTELAKHFNCIYIHSKENIPVVRYDVDTGKHVESFLKLVDRTYNVFRLIKEDYVMWLEDDVSINQKITDTFKYDLNGYCPNSINISALKEKYTFLDENNVYRFSGHGGSVYHRTNLMKSFENKEMIVDVLRNWIKYKFGNAIAQDILFSVLITLNNGTIGKYKGHEDCNIYDSNIPVQHQYKIYYKVDMPDNLKHLVKIT